MPKAKKPKPIEPKPIDTKTEDLIAIAKVPQMIPAVDGMNPPDKQTVYGWMSVGVRGARLACVNLGGQKITSIQAVERFLAEQNK